MKNRNARTAPGYVVLTLRAFEENGQFVSECVELQTASQGDTVGDAIANAREATTVYLEAITDLQQRDRIFEERRIRIVDRVPEDIHLNANVHPGDVVQTVAFPLPELIGAS